jgi:hypothetical protein
MKWRCPVQHKSVTESARKAAQGTVNDAANDQEQWTKIVQPESHFHRKYRQPNGQLALNLRTQREIRHRFSEANSSWPTRPNLVPPRLRPVQRPSKWTDAEKSYTDNSLPPTGTRKVAEPTTIPLRVLWLRAGNVERPKTTGLRNRFGSEGMDIHLTDLQHTDTPVVDLQAINLFPTVFDLIILECVEISEAVMLVQLNSIREVSQAPLIVLTDNYTLDWSLRALREGADAIFTLNTPDDVILARSNALLRRWA